MVLVGLHTTTKSERTMDCTSSYKFFSYQSCRLDQMNKMSKRLRQVCGVEDWKGAERWGCMAPWTGLHTENIILILMIADTDLSP